MAEVRWAFRSATWQPSLSQLSFALQCIQSEERQRISQFMFQRDAKASLAGRLLMRHYLCQVTGLPWPQVNLARSNHGRPFWLPPSHLSHVDAVDFNVSHQGHWVVLAGTSDSSIGIDVMEFDLSRITRLEEFFHTLRRQFTSHEWNTIKQGPASKQLRSFFRHWSLKESYVKAVGIGIGFDLQRLSFIAGSEIEVNKITTDTLLRVDSVIAPWYFEETLLDDHHCVTVALPKKKQMELERNPVSFSVISVDEVLSSAHPLISECQDSLAEKILAREEKPRRSSSP